MITGQPFTMYRDGTDAHDYVYIDDVVDAFVRAGCASIETTGTYNIGKRTAYHSHRGTRSDLRRPGWFVAGQVRRGRKRRLARDRVEPNQSRKKLKWKPTVNLAEGIRRTISWLRTLSSPSRLHSSARDLEQRVFAWTEPTPN